VHDGGVSTTLCVVQMCLSWRGLSGGNWDGMPPMGRLAAPSDFLSDLSFDVSLCLSALASYCMDVLYALTLCVRVRVWEWNYNDHVSPISIHR